MPFKSYLSRQLQYRYLLSRTSYDYHFVRFFVDSVWFRCKFSITGALIIRWGLRAAGESKFVDQPDFILFFTTEFQALSHLLDFVVENELLLGNEQCCTI